MVHILLTPIVAATTCQESGLTGSGRGGHSFSLFASLTPPAAASQLESEPFEERTIEPLASNTVSSTHTHSRRLPWVLRRKEDQTPTASELRWPHAVTWASGTFALVPGRPEFKSTLCHFLAVQLEKSFNHSKAPYPHF